jgi:fido (protein-threonine AMPylation protein)
LQQVDGLTPSKYLVETANANIQGEISIHEAEQFIADYYENRQEKNLPEDRTEEADKVSVRIASVLCGQSFKLSPVELLSIHKRLFNGIYDFAGQIRNFNISKKEWVLNGESVYYGDFNDIQAALDYDFDKEKAFDYANLDARNAVKHMAKFIADVWQTHAFSEGNTRATAVFAIKYLRTFGYDVSNNTFEKHSFYFRNALVRANYNDHKKGIKATTLYLDCFFENLLFGYNHPLQNRGLHVDAKHSITEKLAMKKALSADRTRDDPTEKKNPRRTDERE